MTAALSQKKPYKYTLFLKIPQRPLCNVIESPVYVWYNNDYGGKMNIKELVERVMEDGVVTKKEHQKILKEISKDGQLDEDEAKEIQRLVDKIDSGELTVIE